jgi:macrolide-specific efflux system membrane fusion protein
VTIYELDILPEKVPPIFRSGMSANIEIIEQSKEDILVIPLEALKMRDEGAGLVLIDQGKGEKPVPRKVQLGIADDKNVEVIAGLDPDDKIIVETQIYIPSTGKKPGRNPFMPGPPRGRSSQPPPRR